MIESPGSRLVKNTDHHTVEHHLMESDEALPLLSS